MGQDVPPIMMTYNSAGKLKVNSHITRVPVAMKSLMILRPRFSNTICQLAMSPRRPSSEDSPPRKRHKELPLSFDSPETQLTMDGCVSDGGFDGDLSSPIHCYKEIESEMHENKGSQVEVKNAEQSLDSLYSDDILSQLPTTSQIEFTASQQSLLNWVDNLLQAQADQEAIYQEAELKWLDNSGSGYGGYDEPSNSRHHRSSTPPCSNPCVPCRSSSSFNDLRPREPLDAKDIMLAWYQQHLDT
ncbi:hypothetical protein EV359DRAFT_87211 [Lentinula novae-zelandiae]|nr:hypothetical protein EV359DRAFT_87211 [Lentinula novae-zelandiae]